MKQYTPLLALIGTLAAETTFCDDPSTCDIVQQTPLPAAVLNAGGGLYQYLIRDNFPIFILAIGILIVVYAVIVMVFLKKGVNS